MKFYPIRIKANEADTWSKFDHVAEESLDCIALHMFQVDWFRTCLVTLSYSLDELRMLKLCLHHTNPVNEK